jgi:DNA-binding transcriptional ArsR family regulator
LCREGELTVGRLVEGSGVSQPAISKHLAVLRSANLVSARQNGRNTHFRVVPSGLAPLVGWVSEMKLFWENRLDSLEDLLSRMDQ